MRREHKIAFETDGAHTIAFRKGCERVIYELSLVKFLFCSYKRERKRASLR